MDQLEFLLLLCSITTSTFVDSNGKSIPSSTSNVQENLRSRRRLPEKFTKHKLPASMTKARILNELIQTDQLDLVVNSSRLYGTECPSSNLQLPLNAPVYARSICPWFYQLRHDPDRFPTSIPVAVSKCNRHCLGLHKNITDDFTCDYVYHDVTVLKKEYNNNVIHFVEKVESIPVGTACVRKKET